ncbi:glutaredoxin family protein [Planococcus sp. APC 3906]|uniref:glutaredoxin family protein n=1 Tax=Planococcus sp. APC 3906 TaxID=3035194 RepID=UPI0025B2CF96|nr:glutaredoxin family protein [Planococcus sp. APC 3906]MDN3449024.1 glutaredoxin family protein [Planococcus sp. APC 3906]
MGEAMEMVLYTRPTCSDCQDAKTYLAVHDISYEHKDVEAARELEIDMKEISGSRIVPLFAFYKRGLFGKRRLEHHFIGFEENKEELKRLFALL